MTTAVPTRLPTTVRPERYRITLEPDLAGFTFHGEQSIDLAVGAAVDRIVLHALELEIAEARVVLEDGTAVAAPQIALDDASETATLHLERTVPPGRATLHMRFTGVLNDQLRGFYRSRYPGPGGEVRHLATTQFEATDARRAFPCWDEPAAKAVFEVTLVIPQELVAISNTPIATETPRGDGKRAVRFVESPRMSTYLVAFVVGDLACVEAPAAGGVQMRVWATRGKEEQGRYALEHAVRLLDYYNGYFGVPYPLPKLDHIAIPDFGAGAMENWGAITYRETALLFDPANSAAGTRQRILEVVAHEMAHMWFGDLVTMAWWDDLWLNESFASWLGDKAVDHLYPDWHMWTQFVSNDTHGGLALDGLRNSHPIEVPVAHPAQIREIFDAISYSKGASVLRMLENHLGEDTFRRGLRSYIARHQYGNARTEDLWAALAEASEQPVPAIMGSWTRQMGYPLLSLRREGGQVTLGQRRFLYDEPDAGRPDPARWTIPVTVAYQGARDGRRHLVEERETSVAVPEGVGAASWAKANWGQAGFFRVDYEAENWDRLAEAVARMELPADDRLGLAGDAYALVRAGLQPATRFLALAEQYRNERDAIVWGSLAGSFYGLETLLLEQPYLPLLRRFVRDLVSPAVQEVGWEPQTNEGHLGVLRRSIVLGLAGAFGHPEVVAGARQRFQGYQADPASLRPDLRAVVIGLAGQEGDRATYDALWDMAVKAELQEEKLRFLRALGRFRQRGLLRLTLARALSEDVRSQDSVAVIGSVAGNRRGLDLAWDFVRANWAELDRRYGRGGYAITSLVAFTGGFTSHQRAEEVAEFFRTHPAPSAQRAVQQALERIALNVAWLERNRDLLGAWFDRRR